MVEHTLIFPSVIFLLQPNLCRHEVVVLIVSILYVSLSPLSYHLQCVSKPLNSHVPPQKNLETDLCYLLVEIFQNTSLADI